MGAGPVFAHTHFVELHAKSREYHPRQWVDRSGAAYKRTRLDRFLEYHPRQWVDRSSPAFIAAHRRSLFAFSPLAARGEITKRKGPGRFCCRPHLNDPPTAVGGIQEVSHGLVER